MPYDSNGNASLVPGYLAVEGQTILPSQHNPPLEDIAQMLSQVLLRSGVAPMTGPLNMNGFRLANLADAVNPSDPATLQQLQDSIAFSGVPTGAVQGFRRTTAPAGWVKENGGTIGNAASGATTRADADTQALFTLLWEQFSNTVLPIQTSAGTASTRGASASADFAANKRMPLFDSRSRFLRGADNGLGYDPAITVGLAQDSQNLAHSHTGSTGSAGAHTHDVARSTQSGSLPGSGFQFGQRSDDNGVTLSAGAHTHPVTINSSGGTEARPRSSAVLFCIKL